MDVIFEFAGAFIGIVGVSGIASTIVTGLIEGCREEDSFIAVAGTSSCFVAFMGALVYGMAGLY